MKLSNIKICNFRNVKSANIQIDGHTLLIGANNVGKSTLCEALDLVIGPDRQNRFPVVDEFDFYNADYIDDNDDPIEIRIEILLTEVTPTVRRLCDTHLERWHSEERRLLAQGEIDQVDAARMEWAVRLVAIARYNAEEDEFEAATYFAKSYDPDNERDSRVSRIVKRAFGFLYLRTLRTGSRALSLERGSLLDIILKIESIQTGIWEGVRKTLKNLDPPIEAGATDLAPVLETIEKRLAEYIPIDKPGEATRLFVSQLTREHLRKTLSFFLSVSSDQEPVPFQNVGTGTLNTLVLALLSFIAELKEENVIFAMEEPEIALPPHTQRRIAEYLTTKTTQCIVTSHSPYVIEEFDPAQILVLRRDSQGTVSATGVTLSADVKAKTYRRHVRRGFAEAMLGKAVILVEGMTETPLIQAVAEKMEAADHARYPLDLAGVTVVSTGGDGAIAEFGRFFGGLDIPTFAIIDGKKNRSQREQDALNNAGFEVLEVLTHGGIEDLLVAEIPTDCQWAYLEALRESGVSLNVAIPQARPADDAVSSTLRTVLKDGKGWGRAAELMDHCKADELPKTLTAFLDTVYTRFNRPAFGGSNDDTNEDAEDQSDQPPEEAVHPDPEEDV